MSDIEVEQLRRQVQDLTAAVRCLAQRLPVLVTVEEAAKHFNVSTRTIRRRLRNREWPTVKVGKHTRIDLAAVHPGFAVL